MQYGLIEWLSGSATMQARVVMHACMVMDVGSYECHLWLAVQPVGAGC
jgi:hypothetical protein